MFWNKLKKYVDHIIVIIRIINKWKQRDSNYQTFDLKSDMLSNKLYCFNISCWRLKIVFQPNLWSFITQNIISSGYLYYIKFYNVNMIIKLSFFHQSSNRCIHRSNNSTYNDVSETFNRVKSEESKSRFSERGS